MKKSCEQSIERPEKVLGANRIAARLFEILNSENEPNALKEILVRLLDAESFEHGLTFNDPRIIRFSFPLLLETIAESENGGAARVFLSAIENLIASYPKVEKTGTDETESTGENDLLTTGKTSIIALAVSNLLNNDFVPAEIKNALQDGLTEIQNGIPQLEVLKIEISPAYINGILIDYRKSNGGEK